MDYEELFRIGDLAGICGITTKTLRFYDQSGLLKPAYVNEQNGYRYYTRWHITRVATIRQLQEMGFLLDDIHFLLNQSETADVMALLSGMLMNQKKELELELERITSKLASLKMLQTRCEAVKDKIHYDSQTEITVKRLPERQIIFIPHSGAYSPAVFERCYQDLVSAAMQHSSSGQNINFTSGPLAIYENGSETGQGGIKIGFEAESGEDNYHERMTCKQTPLGDSPCSRLQFSSCIINEGSFACYTFKGPYHEMHASISRDIRKKIRNMGYSLSDLQIEYYYLHEAFTTQDHYLTEIQIPVNITEN